MWFPKSGLRVGMIWGWMAFVGLQSVWATTTACQPGKWALTFDDGPHPSISSELLSLLRANNVKATFFVVGQNVEYYPDILRQIYAEGHEIAVHSWSHPDLTTLTTDQLREQIRSTMDIIYSVIQVTPTLVRPPYGSTNGEVKEIMDEFGLEEVIWNVDSNDWRYAQQYSDSYEAGEVTKQEMLNSLNAMDPSTTGVISLQHDIHQASVYTIGEVINAIRAKGFTLSTVQQCIAGPYRPSTTISSTSTVISSTLPPTTSDSATQTTDSDTATMTSSEDTVTETTDSDTATITSSYENTVTETTDSDTVTITSSYENTVTETTDSDTATITSSYENTVTETTDSDTATITSSYENTVTETTDSGTATITSSYENTVTEITDSETIANTTSYGDTAMETTDSETVIATSSYENTVTEIIDSDIGTATPSTGSDTVTFTSFNEDTITEITGSETATATTGTTTIIPPPKCTPKVKVGSTTSTANDNTPNSTPTSSYEFIHPRKVGKYVNHYRVK